MLPISYYALCCHDKIPSESNLINEGLFFVGYLEGIQFITVRSNGDIWILSCDSVPPHLPTREEKGVRERQPSASFFLSSFCFNVLVNKKAHHLFSVGLLSQIDTLISI